MIDIYLETPSGERAVQLAQSLLTHRDPSGNSSYLPWAKSTSPVVRCSLCLHQLEGLLAAVQDFAYSFSIPVGIRFKIN